MRGSIKCVFRSTLGETVGLICKLETGEALVPPIVLLRKEIILLWVPNAEMRGSIKCVFRSTLGETVGPRSFLLDPRVYFDGQFYGSRGDGLSILVTFTLEMTPACYN
jgi:hypothetical protein